jgi:KUP system potassium uptake protein
MPSESAIEAARTSHREARAEMVRERRVSRSLLLAALGIVYGDIGTSPLYAFREALRAAPAGIEPRQHTLGCVSLIFWALIIVVTVKYVMIVLRATSQGEGGIVTLTALASDCLRSERWRHMMLTTGLVGIAFFYGDSILTPSISVLSAIEGLQIATPVFEPYVVLLAIAILAVLFVVQHRGTARLGAFLGPVMAAWFALLAISGIVHIARHPEVLRAANPVYALEFLQSAGWSSVFTLGATFLAVTGAEALYADVGHFSKRIVRLNWFFIVLPALVLNYFGQAALVLRRPEAAANPFYSLFHETLLFPVVGLATAATVIASQAVITGAFTLSLQAMQLRLLPRLETRFTSKTHVGQVYVREMNWMLAVAVVLTVATFRSSEALAGAYGLAVATTMVVTTLLASVVALFLWRWPLRMVVLCLGSLLLIDLVFFGANAFKIIEGGWFPLAIGCAAFVIMRTWRQGREAIMQRLAQENGTIEAFWRKMRCDRLPRVPGTAIYLTSSADAAPSALAVQVRHNRCLHRSIVLLTVITERIPRVSRARRVLSKPLRPGLTRVSLRFGFAEAPDVPGALEDSPEFSHIVGDRMISYFTGREIPVPSPRPDLPGWKEPIFLCLTKFSANAADYFCLPPKQVVELATKIEV